MSEESIVLLLRKINEKIKGVEFESSFEKDNFSLLNGDSLFSGNLGLVIYHYYFGKTFKDEKSLKIANKLLEKIIDRIESGNSSLNNHKLSYGLSGFIMVIKHLRKKKFITYDDSDFEIIYSLSKEWILESIKNDDLEYMHGASGAILGHSDEIINDKAFLDVLIDQIEKKIKKSKKGNYIYMINPFVPDYPGCINLSLSHGYSGFLLVFLKLIQKGASITKLQGIVNEGISFLISNLSDVDFEKKVYCHSDIVIYPNESIKKNSRLAWCYGDLNIAILLIRAGKLLENNEYIKIGNNIAFTTLSRKNYDQTFINSSQFCHGSSGLINIYNKLFQLTGLPEYSNAQKYWTKRTIQYIIDEIDENYYEDKNHLGELVEGLPGVALTLFPEVNNEIDQDWDELFLLS